jgi:hypothetical protein
MLETLAYHHEKPSANLATASAARHDVTRSRFGLAQQSTLGLRFSGI